MDRHDEKGRFKKGVSNVSEGIGARQNPDFLDDQNWSKSKVAEDQTRLSSVADDWKRLGMVFNSD